MISNQEVIRTAILVAEEALGENLVWITDRLDLAVRQKDRETLARLAALNEAWIELCKAKAIVEDCERS